MIRVDTMNWPGSARSDNASTSNRRQGCSRGVGYEKVYMLVEDASRLA